MLLKANNIERVMKEVCKGWEIKKSERELREIVEDELELEQIIRELNQCR